MNKLQAISHRMATFNAIRENDCAYVDKTGYIELLERLKVRFPFIVRPRGFGKSLFCTMLEAYYDRRQETNFEKLFKGTYIFDHRTSSQGQFHVLRLSFSGVDDGANTKYRFIEALKDSLSAFFRHYPMDGADELLKRSFPDPDELLRAFCTFVNPHTGRTLYVIIDEYDPFSEEMLARDAGEFKKLSSKTLWLQNFFTAIKDATMNTVARVFITGGSAISIEPLIAGVDCAENLSFDPDFAGMLGFTEDELREFIPRVIDLEKNGQSLDEVVARLRDHCNGYVFSTESESRIFKPFDCLCYLRCFAAGNAEISMPADPAARIDLSQLRAIMKLADETQVKNIVSSVLCGETVPMPGIEQTLNLNFKNRFSYAQLLTALLYTGFLTFTSGDRYRLRCPNRAIMKRFKQYCSEDLAGSDSIGLRSNEVKPRHKELRAGGNDSMPGMVTAWS